MGMSAYYGKRDDNESSATIREALDLGINFFDTADMYSTGVSEEILGRALKSFGPSRDRLIIATKVFNAMGDDPNLRGLSRKHIMHAIDDSLRRLGTDYVDLYQIHRFDSETPIEETLEAMADVVKAGKARYLGASSMWAWQFAKMRATSAQRGWPKFISMQNHYNLIYREEEREMIPLCRAEGVGIIPYSPLARGRLVRGAGNQTRRAETDDYGNKLYGGTTESDNRVVAQLERVAKAHGTPPAQVALAWMLHKPGITSPIVGASKPGHLEDALAALKIKLTPEEISALEAPYVPHSILGHE